MHTLYNIGIRLYTIAIFFASPFNSKAKLWLSGRKNWKTKISDWRKGNPGKLIWMHCASLGEFEQGRPVIEKLKKDFPQQKILLTFFSPSGFEVRKNYEDVNGVFYLPIDTPANARMFFEIIQPALILFIKYEFWANYFFEAKRKNVPLFIVSGIFREEQRFFGQNNSFWKKVLQCVTHFFLQDEVSKKLLNSIKLSNSTVCGDTRFDRVMQIASSAKATPIAEAFSRNSNVIVAGSSYPEEENMIAEFLKLNRDCKAIIVPHEVSESRIDTIMKVFGPDAIRFSTATESDVANHQVLVVDSVGLLSSLYRYGKVAVIGGGFGKGIHNILEAAVWGAPVIFGPKYQKFDEARQLVEKAGAFSATAPEDVIELIQRLASEDLARANAGQIAANFVHESAGAAERVTNHLREFLA